MNRVCIVGRLSQEVEVRYGTNSTVAKTAIAVQREFKDSKTGEYGVDFINITAFGHTAEFLEKYFHKGMRIGIVGHIQTGSYTDKDGNKRYTFDVVADSAEFVESKGNTQNAPQQNPAPQEKPANDGFVDDGFTNVTDDLELPFE